MTDQPDVVASVDARVVARIRALLGERHRGRSEILIENEVNVRGALEASMKVLHLFTSSRSKECDLVRSVAPEVPTSVVADEVLAQLFERTRVPDLFAIVPRPERQHFRAFAARPGDIVVLDALDGPGNIGSVIRVAAAFEAAGIVVLDQQPVDLYRRGIIRASAGTMFKLPIVTATVQSFVRFCKASGTRIVTTSSHAPGGFVDVVNCADRLALVFGSETQGCDSELEALAELQCRIPMNAQVESLNVSAAASVLLFARKWLAGTEAAVAHRLADEESIAGGRAPWSMLRTGCAPCASDEIMPPSSPASVDQNSG